MVKGRFHHHIAVKKGASHAFTMIELIFAIVIIALIVVAVPRIIATNSLSMERSIVQEGIYAVATKISQILSFHWDQNSLDTTETLSTSKILDIAGGTANYTRSAIPDANATRIGGLVLDYHRRFHDTVTNATATMTGGSVGTLGENIGSDLNFTETQSTGSGGYKRMYRMDSNVIYVSDRLNSAGGSIDVNASNTPFGTNDFVFSTSSLAAGTTSNLKMVELWLEQSDDEGVSWQRVVVLRAYAANIGEIDFVKRRY